MSGRDALLSELPWQDQGGLLQTESTALGVQLQGEHGMGKSGSEEGSGCGASVRLEQEWGLQPWG